MFMTCVMGLVLAGVSNGAATFAGPDALTISIDGSCPGVVRFRWDGASPDQWAGLIYSDERGNFTLNQPCGGTVTGLGTRGLRLVWLFRTGAAGQGAASGRAASPSCGGFLQMVVQDGNPCSTSNVVQIPQ